MKRVKSLEESDVNETIKNEAKEQKWGSLSMLSGALGAILLENRQRHNWSWLRYN